MWCDVMWCDAKVGRALASTEEDAYPILESLDVDYVLLIFGGRTTTNNNNSSDDIHNFLSYTPPSLTLPH